MNLTLKEELEKQNRKREDRIHTKEAFQYLKTYVSREREEALEKLDAIKRDAEQKIVNTQKREERQKRQLEIAEEAANDDKNESAGEKREGLMLQRIWYSFLQSKIVLQRGKYATIENAFERVRTVGGLGDVEEMVQKTLSKE